MDDTDLKSDIAAAFDAAESNESAPSIAAPAAKEPVADTVVAPREPIGESAEARDARLRDEKGRFAAAPEKQEPKKIDAPPPENLTPPDGASPPKEAAPPPAEPEKPKLKAPASWKPTSREGWDKVPPDIQQEVWRRERETAMALQETTEARHTHQKFKETISPYEHLFRAEGVDPIQGIGNLMRTTAALATGPQQTKAQIVAGIIKTYGVDLPTLDALLSGQTPPPGAVEQRPPYDPRLDALLAQAEKVKAQREAQSQAKFMEQIQEVQGEEFFQDVREDMADIIEIADKRGVTISLRDAYNRAVALHPEVSRVIEQRKAAAASGSVQRSMAASSSVRGQPSAAPAASAGGNMRDDLEAAMKRLNSRG